MEKKICYTALEDFKATPTGAVSPLIDAGLMSPQGIAVDKVGGFLYVAVRTPCQRKWWDWQTTSYRSWI